MRSVMCLAVLLACAVPTEGSTNIKPPGSKEISRTTFEIKIPVRHIKCAHSPAGDYKRESIDANFAMEKWIWASSWDTEAGQLYDQKAYFNLMSLNLDCKTLQSAIAKQAGGGFLKVEATRIVTVDLEATKDGCMAQWHERVEAPLPLGLKGLRVRRFETRYKDKAGQCAALPTSSTGKSRRQIRFHPQAASNWGIQCVAREQGGTALAFVPNVTNQVSLVSKRRFTDKQACETRRAAIIKAASQRDPSNNGEQVTLTEEMRLSKAMVSKRKALDRVHATIEARYEGERFISESSFELW